MISFELGWLMEGARQRVPLNAEELEESTAQNREALSGGLSDRESDRRRMDGAGRE